MAKRWKPTLLTPDPAKLFATVSFASPDFYLEVRKDLVSVFSEIDYEKEVRVERESIVPESPRPFVRILGFTKPVGREEIVDLERKALSLQSRHQKDGEPIVEIWPGYITEFVAVRASLMDDFHHLYMYGGIFAEIVYRYEKGGFRVMEGVQDFYRRLDVMEAFQEMRMIYASWKKKK